jgi:hypothetical protein
MWLRFRRPARNERRSVSFCFDVRVVCETAVGEQSQRYRARAQIELSDIIFRHPSTERWKTEE